MWLIVTGCEDYGECDGCGFEIINTEEDVMQVENLRVAKNFLWRQEELELAETRRRESTLPVVKPAPPHKSEHMHDTLVCLLMARTFEKVLMEVVQSTQKNSHKEMAKLLVVQCKATEDVPKKCS